MAMHNITATNEIHGGSSVEHRARAILEKKITEGALNAVRVIERVQTQTPTDAIIRTARTGFVGGESDGGEVEGFHMVLPDGMSVGLHRHARGQIAQKAGVPGAYLEELTQGSAWQRGLAAKILTDHFENGAAGERALVRIVDKQARGFLSDRYRRLDARPLLDAFVGAAQQAGALPVDGTVSDVRVAMKAVLPLVYTPVANEAIAFGVEWGTSDFGAARHSVRAFILRLWCLNGATLEDELSQVHVGGRLPDAIEFSERTMRLDTQASVSALGDVVRGTLSPKKVEAMMSGIAAAADKQVSWAQLKNKIGKRLLAAEVKAVEDAWQTQDIAILPAGDTAWRASNALSWVAKSIVDPDRKLEIERLSGVLLNGKDD